MHRIYDPTRPTPGTDAHAGGLSYGSGEYTDGLQRLSDITPLTMSYVSRHGNRSYWFSDPYVCHCIYVGSQQDYQEFEQLKEQASAEKSAEEAQSADQERFDQFMASPAGQVFYGQ
jgi:hypothetical protein